MQMPRAIFPLIRPIPMLIFIPGRIMWMCWLLMCIISIMSKRITTNCLILAKGKLITLGECGELPKPEILKVQPRFTWFMVWGGFIQHDNPPGRVKEIYNLPQVITHDEVKF